MSLSIRVVAQNAGPTVWYVNNEHKGEGHNSVSVILSGTDHALPPVLVEICR